MSRRSKRVLREAIAGTELDLVRYAMASLHFRKKGRVMPAILHDHAAQAERNRRLLLARQRRMEAGS